MDRTYVRVNFLMQEEEQHSGLAEMGRLLQAATTNNLSGKREESTENWFLHSLHSHTEHGFMAKQNGYEMCACMRRYEESNTFTGQIIIPGKGTRDTTPQTLW